MADTKFTINTKKRIVECKCPQCDGVLQCPFAEAGTKQQCPECSRAFTVPGAKDVETVLAYEHAEENRQTAAAERQRAEVMKLDELARANASRPQTVTQTTSTHYDSARSWGGSLGFVSWALLLLGSLGLLASIILFATNSTPPADYADSASVMHAQMIAAENRALITTTIAASLGTIFIGCAFGGLGQIVLLLRMILIRQDQAATKPRTP